MQAKERRKDPAPRRQRHRWIGNGTQCVGGMDREQETERRWEGGWVPARRRRSASRRWPSKVCRAATPSLRATTQPPLAAFLLPRAPPAGELRLEGISIRTLRGDPFWASNRRGESELGPFLFRTRPNRTANPMKSVMEIGHSNPSWLGLVPGRSGGTEEATMTGSDFLVWAV
jgi:hypothetical protein